MSPVRLVMALILATLLGSRSEAQRPHEAQASRTNFVYILCDDLGYGDLACYGHPVIQTPHLDRLAASGMRLTACYAAAPVCSPARAGIMTGRNPNRMGIRDWIPADSEVHLKANEITVASLLNRAGYRTALVGKWHLSGTLDGSQPTPGDHGFDHWFATQNNAAPSHENPVNFVRNGEPVGPLTGFSSTLIIDEAIRFLDSLDDDDAPFALFVWFHAPHEPIATPEEYTRLYDDQVDDPTKRIYYGSVTMIDHEVGRLVTALEARGLRDETFIMFTSDNGPETLNRYRGAERSHGSPGPLRGMKLHMHEGGYRVPGIISWPGTTTPGQVCDEPVNGTDILPTFCEIAGIDIPHDRPIDGASMLPIFDGRSIERTQPLYWQYDRAISPPWKLALVHDGWKLLGTMPPERFALFNLHDDPAETDDLAEAMPEKVRALAENLSRLYREINNSLASP